MPPKAPAATQQRAVQTPYRISWVLVVSVLVLLIGVGLQATRVVDCTPAAGFSVQKFFPKQLGQLAADFTGRTSRVVHKADQRLDNVTAPEPSCGPSGLIGDCGCDFASVDKLNAGFVNPLLKQLVQTPYFTYFKASLWCDCPFWPDDGMCMLRDCSVCECEPDEVPRAFKDADAASCGADLLREESAVDRGVEEGVQAQLRSIPAWRGLNNPWLPEEDAGQDFSYINLQANPERYTGYEGEHPHRIWDLIYSQSCFLESLEACTERRVFYRLISGMHASISAHIAADYLLDEVKGAWGPSQAQFQARLGGPEAESRVANLYFAYLFVLRAVLKAGPVLARSQYRTGDVGQDALTAGLIQRLVNAHEVQASCPLPFDEGQLWRGDDAQELRTQLQASFRNITAVMDCVGCEKCKLWGKLQLLGIATSLKILFTADECVQSAPPTQQPQLQLERNEVIALMNLLERLSNSIEVVRVMSAEQGSSAHPAGSVGGLSGLEQRVSAESVGVN